MKTVTERVLKMPKAVLRIDSADNVAVALRALRCGETLGDGLTLAADVPAGHKVALRAIAPGASVIKYGYIIGVARRRIEAGEHVHVHNLTSALAESVAPVGYFRSSAAARAAGPGETFEGYRRPNGTVAVRNEIWILNTVGCVNHTAARIAGQAAQEIVREGSAVEGIHTFGHPFGCSQLHGDLEQTRRVLAGLARHPNAAGVLVLGLGCENNGLEALLQSVGEAHGERLRFFNAQNVADEVKTGVRLVHELADYAGQFKRQRIGAEELVLGMKCGGSDGLSGITANPLVGRVADKLAALGGTSILTEVPEMFGAEAVLLERAADAQVQDATLRMVNGFRAYFRQHHEPIDENPSPGNKEGGITTLAEKSLGCVQKGGTSAVRQVLAYGEQARTRSGGVALLNGPGNDGVSGTALSAAGAHMVLFTTGRGTPMGFPVPTIKIASNSELAQRKANWIDLDAGALAEGTETDEDLDEELFRLVLDVASGRARTRSEVNGYREISIWKGGVTL